MLVTFTVDGKKDMPRVCVQIDKPLQLKTVLNKYGPVALLLSHFGNTYAVAMSTNLQNQYLFLEKSKIKEMYEEVIIEIHSEETKNIDRIDIDEILLRVFERNKSDFEENAIRANLQFNNTDAYKKEVMKWGTKCLNSHIVLARFAKERQLMKRLIMKGSTKSREYDAKKVIIQAVMAIAYIRTCTGESGTEWNRQQYEQWLSNFLCPKDMETVVQYCSRPKLNTNSHLENLLNILLNKCPCYPVVNITAN